MHVQIASCKASDLGLPVYSGLQQSLLRNNSSGRDRKELVSEALREGFESSGLSDSCLVFVLR